MPMDKEPVTFYSQGRRIAEEGVNHQEAMQRLRALNLSPVDTNEFISGYADASLELWWAYAFTTLKALPPLVQQQAVTRIEGFFQDLSNEYLGGKHE